MGVSERADTVRKGNKGKGKRENPEREASFAVSPHR